MKKNDLFTAEITAMSAEGSGIAKIEGMAVFIPQTAPGDIAEIKIVKVKSRYAYGIVNRIISPSQQRADNDCGAFRQCGGCVYRHIKYSEECRLKSDRVANAVKRIGKISLEPEHIIPAFHTERYRNKAQYPVSEDGSVGFYATHSHRIVPCGDCLLQPAEFAEAANALKKWINESSISVYNELTHSGLIRHLYLRHAETDNGIMAVIVINGNDIPNKTELISTMRSALGEKLKSLQLNINTADTNVILGDKCILLYGDSFINDTLCGIDIRLSPLSFYQVNREMAERLYLKAAEYACPDGKVILDLYCGAGTIGLSMARRAKLIIGVEIVPQAVEDARFNARSNKIENAEFICADAAAAAKQLAERRVLPDVVIVDPPRKGCDEQLLITVAQNFRPERLVYISCDPATLARDAARLNELGYSLTEYTPVDLFPRTAHIETAALFEKIASDA